jgi:hypothetical protein
MWKNIVLLGKPQMTVWCLHIACSQTLLIQVLLCGMYLAANKWCPNMLEFTYREQMISIWCLFCNTKMNPSFWVFCVFVQHLGWRCECKVQSDIMMLITFFLSLQQLKNFLHPRCLPCGKEFPTRVEWDHHKLTPLHLKVCILPCTALSLWTWVDLMSLWRWARWCSYRGSVRITGGP